MTNASVRSLSFISMKVVYIRHLDRIAHIYCNALSNLVYGFQHVALNAVYRMDSHYLTRTSNAILNVEHYCFTRFFPLKAAFQLWTQEVDFKAYIGLFSLVGLCRSR